jgi:hypothetical protein
LGSATQVSTVLKYFTTGTVLVNGINSAFSFIAINNLVAEEFLLAEKSFSKVPEPKMHAL